MMAATERKEKAAEIIVEGLVRLLAERGELTDSVNREGAQSDRPLLHLVEDEAPNDGRPT